jgi:hypothetical protein
MDMVSYRERGRVTVEIEGIVDGTDRSALLETLRLHLISCQEPELLVRLVDQVVTSAALHVLDDLYREALVRDVCLRVRVHPHAVKIFHATGLEYLLH